MAAFESMEDLCQACRMNLLDDPIDPAAGWQSDHLREYVATGGEQGHTWNGVPTLLLTVRDLATGRGRRTPLIYGRDGEDYVVVASAGGRPQHPLWYRCLDADPDVAVQVFADVFPAKAITVTGERRDRLWRLMTDIWPAYDDYQTKTDRQIPIVALTPAG
jgi:deazaflavin-dependent oxidoreductase (nitroreductase family)